GLPINERNIESLKYSVATNNFLLFRSYFKDLIGYLIWANVDEDFVRFARISKTTPLYDYEYNDGDITYIIDLAVDPDYKLDALNMLYKNLRNFDKYFYYRNAKFRSKGLPQE